MLDARDYMIDGGFESNPTRWTLGGTPGFADVQSSIVRSGARALHLRLRNTPSAAGGQADTAILTPPYPNGALGLAFYLRSTVNVAQFVFRIYHFPDGLDQPKVFLLDIASVAALNQWLRVAIPVRPRASSYGVQLIPQDTGGATLGSIDWYVDDVVLIQQPDELGDPARSYCWFPRIYATPENGLAQSFDLNALFSVSEPLPSTLLPTEKIFLRSDDLSGADNTYVDPWVDRSDGTLYTQLAALERPKLFNSVLNGHKVVRVTNGSQTLASTSPKTFGGPWTVACVYGASTIFVTNWMFGELETVGPSGTSNKGIGFPSQPGSSIAVAYSGTVSIIGDSAVAPYNVVIVRRDAYARHHVLFNGVDVTPPLPFTGGGQLYLHGLFSVDADSLPPTGTELLEFRAYDEDIGDLQSVLHNLLKNYYALPFDDLSRLSGPARGNVRRVDLRYDVEREAWTTLNRRSAPLIRGLRPRVGIEVETLTADAQATLAENVSLLMREDVRVDLSLDGGATRRPVGLVQYRGPEPIGGKTPAGAFHRLDLVGADLLTALPRAVDSQERATEHLIDGHFQEWITATNPKWWTDTVSGGNRAVADDYALVDGDTCLNLRRAVGPPATCQVAQVVYGLLPGDVYHLLGYLWPTGTAACDLRVRLRNLTRATSWNGSAWVAGTVDAIRAQPTDPFWYLLGTAVLIDANYAVSDAYQVELDSQCAGAAELFLDDWRLRGPMPPVGGALW